MAYTWLNAGAWRVPPRDNKPLVISADKSAQGRTRSGTWLEPAPDGGRNTRQQRGRGEVAVGDDDGGYESGDEGAAGRRARRRSGNPGTECLGNVARDRDASVTSTAPHTLRRSYTLFPTTIFSLRHENHNKDIAAEGLHGMRSASAFT